MYYLWIQLHECLQFVMVYALVLYENTCNSLFVPISTLTHTVLQFTMIVQNDYSNPLFETSWPYSYYIMIVPVCINTYCDRRYRKRYQPPVSLFLVVLGRCTFFHRLERLRCQISVGYGFELLLYCIETNHRLRTLYGYSDAATATTTVEYK